MRDSERITRDYYIPLLVSELYTSHPAIKFLRFVSEVNCEKAVDRCQNFARPVLHRLMSDERFSKVTSEIFEVLDVFKLPAESEKVLIVEAALNEKVTRYNMMKDYFLPKTSLGESQIFTKEHRASVRKHFDAFTQKLVKFVAEENTLLNVKDTSQEFFVLAVFWAFELQQLKTELKIPSQVAAASEGNSRDFEIIKDMIVSKFSQINKPFIDLRSHISTGTDEGF